MIESVCPGWTGLPVTINPTPTQRLPRLRQRIKTITDVLPHTPDSAAAAELVEERDRLVLELSRME